MKRLALLLAIGGATLPACKSGGGSGPTDITYHSSQMAEDDEPPPSYSKSELQKALIDERGAEASAERHVTEMEASGDVDQVRMA